MLNLTPSPYQSGGRRSAIYEFLACSMTSSACMRVDVEALVLADPEIVWDLLADITRVPEWSPECVHTAWLDKISGVCAGARFTGRNRARNGFEWTVTCVVTEAERPRTFAWIVLADPQEPDVVSSYWRCELEPVAPDVTRVRQSFRHGPGGSGLRWMVDQDPDRADHLIEDRR
jgi:Polyketide cyclase / dehydrase and lipid transport